MAQPKMLIFGFASVLAVVFLPASALAPAHARGLVFAAQGLPLGHGLAIQDPLWRWPVDDPAVIRPFLKPSSEWGSGHRGIDLDSRPGDPLFSPADGRIGFSGLAFGVPTVVLEIGALSSVFQPACLDTEFNPESEIIAGEQFAEVCSSNADHHCAPGDCLHWSLKPDKIEYLNPLIKLDEIAPATLLDPTRT